MLDSVLHVLAPLKTTCKVNVHEQKSRRDLTLALSSFMPGESQLTSLLLIYFSHMTYSCLRPVCRKRSGRRTRMKISVVGRFRCRTWDSYTCADLRAPCALSCVSSRK